MIATFASSLGGWTHDLNPIIFSVGGLHIRWYGVAYLAGFIAGYLILRLLSKRGLSLIPTHRVGDMVLALAFGVVIGGRVGYAVFYEPSLLIRFDSTFPFWGLLRLHDGGMSSHGGIVGVIVAAWMVSRGWKAEDGSREGASPPLHVMDLVAFVCPLGLFFGRIANFVNGELLGRVVAQPGEQAPWWGVRYPQELLTRHRPDLSDPQALALVRLVDSFRLPGMSDAEAISAMIAALQQGSIDVHERLSPLLAARHPSQLYQAAAEGLVLGAVLVFVWARPRRPGVVGAWFMMTYGALRIWTETLRLPDDHLAAAHILGLTRGQWLSAAMVLVGVFVLVLVARMGKPKLGGWLNA